MMDAQLPGQARVPHPRGVRSDRAPDIGVTRSADQRPNVLDSDGVASAARWGFSFGAKNAASLLRPSPTASTLWSTDPDVDFGSGDAGDRAAVGDQVPRCGGRGVRVHNRTTEGNGRPCLTQQPRISP